MFCTKCGAQNPDDAVNCISCGNPMQVSNINNVSDNSGNNAANSPIEGNHPRVSNNLVWAILATLFSSFTCFIGIGLGIPAIIFASQVDGKLHEGDYEGAIKLSKNAKLFSWLTFGAGLLIYMLMIGIFILGIISVGNEYRAY